MVTCVWVFWLSLLTWWLAHNEYAKYEQQQERAEDGQAEGLKVEAPDRANAEDARADETADQRTDDADDDGEQAAAGIFARHDELGDPTSQQTKNDPGKNIHGRSGAETGDELLEFVGGLKQLHAGCAHFFGGSGLFFGSGAYLLRAGRV